MSVPRRRRKNRWGETLECRYALSANFSALAISLDSFAIESPRIERVDAAIVSPPAWSESFRVEDIPSVAVPSVPLESVDLQVANGTRAHVHTPESLVMNPIRSDHLPVAAESLAPVDRRIRIESPTAIAGQSFDLGTPFASDSFVHRGVVQQNGGLYFDRPGTSQSSNDTSGRSLADSSSAIDGRDTAAAQRPTRANGGDANAVGVDASSPLTASGNTSSHLDTDVVPEPSTDDPVSEHRSEMNTDPASSRMLFGWTMPRLTDKTTVDRAAHSDFAAANTDQTVTESTSIDLSHVLNARRQGRLTARYRLADARDWMAVDVAFAEADAVDHHGPATQPGILLGRYRRSVGRTADASFIEPAFADQASLSRHAATEIALVYWTPHVQPITDLDLTAGPVDSMPADRVPVDDSEADLTAEWTSLTRMLPVWAVWDTAAWALLGTSLAGLGLSLGLTHLLENEQQASPFDEGVTDLRSRRRISRGALGATSGS